MLSNDYKVNESDKCIYYKYGNNICTIICLYIDDLLTFDSKIHIVNYVKSLFITTLIRKAQTKLKQLLVSILLDQKRELFYESHKVEKILRKCNYLIVNQQASYQLSSSLVFSSVLISDSFHSGLSQYHLFQKIAPPMMLNVQPLVA